MNKKSILAIIVGVVVLLVTGALIAGGVGKNDAQNWQIVQSVGGNVSVRDQAGWYPKWFATVWTYPRYVDKTWNDVRGDGEKELESIRTTFNDGGTAQVSTYVRYMTPVSEEQRIEFHRQFAGNIENATISVKAHQINCVKATGPLMSASENQSARKAEFTQLIWDQLADGLYGMRRVEKKIIIEPDFIIEDDSVVPSIINTPAPKVEFKLTTELILDLDNRPVIVKASPLISYGIKILQFSVTGIEYDADTLKQFSTKKLAYLAAEQSKADREKEKYERYNIIEKGLREVAEAQAAGNVEKETAVVAAQLKAEVAEQAKVEAETVAGMALAVALIEKEQAQVKFETSVIDGNAIIVLAKAEEEKIRLAGAITELEQMTIDAKVLMNDAIADAIKNIQSPYNVFYSSGGEGSGDSNWTQTLVQLKLMKDIGFLSDMHLPIDKGLVEREYNRKAAPAIK